MKALGLALLMLLSFTTAHAGQDILFDSINKDSIEDYVDADDIEIVSFNPYWNCGPCKLYSFVADAPINEDRALDARTVIGRFFNKEVTFNRREISDSEAKSLGLTGYPSTAVFIEGEFMGLFTGAVSLRQLGEAMDQILSKKKFQKRAKKYLRKK